VLGPDQDRLFMNARPTVTRKLSAVSLCVFVRRHAVLYVVCTGRHTVDLSPDLHCPAIQ
jgi:hypothetical protein